MEALVLRSWTCKGRPEATLIRETEKGLSGFKRYIFKYTRFYYSGDELTDTKVVKIIVSPDHKVEVSSGNPMGRYWHTANKDEQKYIKRVHFAESCSMVHFDKNLMNDKVKYLN